VLKAKRKSTLINICIITSIIFVTACKEEFVGFEKVSVHQLIFSSDNYLGNKVSVKGFFARGEGSHQLFATKDDALLRNNPAGITIEYHDEYIMKSREPCLDRFVQFLGVYKSDSDSSKGVKLFILAPGVLLDVPDGISGTEAELCNPY